MVRGSKYHILDSKEALEKFDRDFFKGGKPKHTLISLDTETNGLSHWKDVVIGFSFSFDNKSGYYVPLLHWEGGKEGYFKDFWRNAYYPEDVTQKEYKAPKMIKDYVKRWFDNGQVDLILHNAPFDCLMIENNFGLDLSPHVFCDVWLLKHVIDENTKSGLKDIAQLWQKELGIPAEEQANKEQLEMGASVIANGGKYNMRNKHVWRCDLEILAKYAIADTFLTFGIFEVGIEKLKNEYEEKHFSWFFEDEVMPLCREVVIPMKREGMRINVEHFQQLEKETGEKLEELENRFVNILEERGFLKDFPLGKTLEEAVTAKRLVEKIIILEGLDYPVKVVKGDSKKSLAKDAVKKAYEKDPHWLWGYILGYNELKYSSERLIDLKKDLYAEVTGKKHRFNLNSTHHLTWLFCDKLGMDKAKLPQTDGATKKNPKPQMNADVLEEHFLEKYDFVKSLLLYKKLKKQHSTYILPALNLNVDGILYMEMLQAGTTSGRFACAGGYNLQTLPKVEELEACSKCGSSKILIENPIKLLATVTCMDCKHVEEEVLCPSAIKEGFIPPKGMKIINSDYSSLEPRCFAFMSKEDKLKEVFEKNLDIYSKVYCDMMGEEYRNLKKTGENELRNQFKQTPLGIVYGSRGPQVANMMNLKKTIDIRGDFIEVLDIERGNAMRNLYLQTYPNLKEYMQECEMQANVKGYVETLVGRRRHFIFAPHVYKLLIKSGIDYETFIDTKRRDLQTIEFDRVLNKEALQDLSKKCGFNIWDDKRDQMRDWSFIKAMYKNELDNAKNFRIQGLAAHVANRAMLEETRLLKKAGLNARVCLQVHDEITSYVAEKDVPAAAALKKRAMETNKFARLIDVEMIADPVICENLKDSK